MGLLVNGEWKDAWYDTRDTGGQFVRSASSFRNFVTADGSASVVQVSSPVTVAVKAAAAAKP